MFKKGRLSGRAVMNARGGGVVPLYGLILLKEGETVTTKFPRTGARRCYRKKVQEQGKNTMVENTLARIDYFHSAQDRNLPLYRTDYDMSSNKLVPCRGRSLDIFGNLVPAVWIRASVDLVMLPIPR